MNSKSLTSQKIEEDEILVLGLPLRTLLGVYPEERKALRIVRADLKIGFDVSAASRSDRLEDTLDWAELSGRLKALAKASSYRLLETLAARVAEEVLVDERVSFVDVTLWKPHALPGTNLGVRLVRTRKDLKAMSSH